MVLAALSIASCTGSGDVEVPARSAEPSLLPSRTGLEEPCPDGVTLGLGAPFRGRDYAKFQTVGGTVYVSVGQFSDGTTDDGGVGPSTIYIGELTRPPTYDPQADRVVGTIATTSVADDTWSAIDLGAGRYWLTAAGGWDIAIRSCEPDGVAKAATPGDGPSVDAATD
jgi:hypothetical protein